MTAGVIADGWLSADAVWRDNGRHSPNLHTIIASFIASGAERRQTAPLSARDGRWTPARISVGSTRDRRCRDKRPVYRAPPPPIAVPDRGAVSLSVAVTLISVALDSRSRASLPVTSPLLTLVLGAVRTVCQFSRLHEPPDSGRHITVSDAAGIRPCHSCRPTRFLLYYHNYDHSRVR